MIAQVAKKLSKRERRQIEVAGFAFRTYRRARKLAKRAAARGDDPHPMLSLMAEARDLLVVACDLSPRRAKKLSFDKDAPSAAVIVGVRRALAYPADVGIPTAGRSGG